MKHYLFTLLVLLVISKPVYAWGPLGHQAICDGAWRASSKSVQQRLGNTAKRMGYKTFAQACVWADHIRRQMRYDYLAPLHYMNVPRKTKTITEADCTKFWTQEPSCVSSAIDYYADRMTDNKLSVQERDEALLLVGHFVGDIHQPLHVSYQDDRGGTRYPLVFEGKPQSLHQLWDGDILYCGYSGSWKQLGRRLFKQSKAEGEQSRAESVAVWANESYQLTRLIYQNLEKQLPQSYCDTYHPLAMSRLQAASERLASLLVKLQ